MPFCDAGGYSFNGTIIKENRFKAVSSYQQPSITESSEIIFIMPSFCFINENEYKITELGSYSFFETKFKEIILPHTIKQIDGGAFELMPNLIRIDLSLVKINKLSQYLFSRCKKLQNVILPPLLKIIETKVFAECEELQMLKLPPLCEIINETAFNSCNSLTTIIFCGQQDIHQNLPETITNVYVDRNYKDISFCDKQIIKYSSLCLLLPQTCEPQKRNLNTHHFTCIVIIIYIVRSQTL